MNWLDACLFAVVAISILEGALKGFVRTGIDFLMMLAGLVCGLWFYHPFSFVLRPWIRPKELAELIAFLSILAASLAVSILAQVFISRVVKREDLGWLDRTAGGLFGIVRGVFGATVAVLVVMAVAPKPLPQTVLDSQLAPSLIDGARHAASAAPDEVRSGFRQACKEIERVVPPNWQKSIAKLRSI